MKIIFMLLLIGAVAALVLNSIEADSKAFNVKVNATTSNVLDVAYVESLKNNDTLSGKLSQTNNGDEKTGDLEEENLTKNVVSLEAEIDAGVNVTNFKRKNEKKDEFNNAGDHATEDQVEEKLKTAGGLGLDSEHDLTSSTERKDSIQGEHCDSSSYSCNIEDVSLLACLRVPGNESPDLSLLVQNKGKHHLSVSISASKYVELERRQIELKENENKKIKVSFMNRRSNHLMILEAGKGKCELDFKDLIDHTIDHEAGGTTLSSSAMVIFLAALLLCASVWPCLSFCKKKRLPKYQKLGMELPCKIEEDESDGWDKSWDDNWDDVEAPKSPLMARRWSNKECWKD